MARRMFPVLEKFASIIKEYNPLVTVENGCINVPVNMSNFTVVSIGALTTIGVQFNGTVVIETVRALDAAQQWLLRWYGLEFCLKHRVISLDL